MSFVWYQPDKAIENPNFYDLDLIVSETNEHGFKESYLAGWIRKRLDCRKNESSYIIFISAKMSDKKDCSYVDMQEFDDLEEAKASLIAAVRF